MERKIGEIFKYEGKKLRVEADNDSECKRCYLNELCPNINKEIIGECVRIHRQDKTSVVFVEVKDEQPQEQAEQSLELNLCEVLKHCPQGETFWSPMLDGVKFSCIDEERQMIIVETIEGHFTWEINADGTISIDEVTSPEVMLYPSKEMRDWSKFTAPWLKSERFDPKTLKAFDKVLIKNACGLWYCNIFSHYVEKDLAPYHCILGNTNFCIPYNDETKHLVGTKDEAPVFYRYWED